MNPYWIKRWLWTIPIFIILTIVTFFLSRSVPGDPVLSIMNTGSESKMRGSQSEAQFIDTYLRISEKYNYHLPLFYFGIYPYTWAYSPDIAPEWRRYTEEIKYWTLKYGVDESAVQFVQVQKEFLAPLINNNEGGATLSNLASRLSKSRDPQEVTELLSLLQNNSAIDRDALDKLKVSWNNLSQKKAVWYSYMPILKWHGAQNQYHKWIINFMKGDWGRSIIDGKQSLDKITKALSWSFPLNIIAWILTLLLSTALGVYTAKRSDSFLSKTLEWLLLAITSTPLFWLSSLAVIYLTGVQMGNVFPSPGGSRHLMASDGLQKVIYSAHFLMLPLICIVLNSIALLSRQLKQMLTIELQKPYVLAALMRGIPEPKVIWRYALPNAMLPLTAYIGRIVPALISGSVIVETIFNIPGIGKLLVQATLGRDWNVVFSLFLLSAILTFAGIYLSDYLLSRISPRSYRQIYEVQ
jgi:peptide/nickel transport system permease protein